MIVKPGTGIQSPEDVAVGVGETQPLPEVPAHTRRMCVQVTDGDKDTIVRVREAGGTAGTGVILVLYGSRVYGGNEGALADLEAEHVGGGEAAVAVQFERD